MTKIRLRLLMLAAATAFAPPLALAGELPPTTPVEQVAVLAAGDHVWFEPVRAAPAAASGGGDVVIVISIPAQTAWVYRGGMLIAASSVSTGRRGHETPIGSFTILQKRVHHRSNLYSNAPMPFMQRLTWDGIALHAGALPGYPASHGCIRLPMAFARRLFQVTEMGAVVHVIDLMVADPARPTMLAPPVLVPDDSVLDGHGFNVVTAPELPRPAVPLVPVVQPIPPVR